MDMYQHCVALVCFTALCLWFGTHRDSRAHIYWVLDIHSTHGRNRLGDRIYSHTCTFYSVACASERTAWLGVTLFGYLGALLDPYLHGGVPSWAVRGSFRHSGTH